MKASEQVELELVLDKAERRERIAMIVLAGFHASGRKFTVHEGKEISLEAAAVMSADKLIEELKKERK